jgi:hypothetical protein
MVSRRQCRAVNTKSTSVIQMIAWWADLIAAWQSVALKLDCWPKG